MNKKSFTLLELIIVLALLAILVSVAVAKFVDLSNKALGIQENATMDAFRTAVLLYKAKYDAWPDGDTFWDPFTILENPPPRQRGFPPPGDGKTWAYLRGTQSPGEFWSIQCPHALGSYSGMSWTYMTVSGPDYFGPEIHNAGAVIKLDDYFIGHH